MRIILNMIFGLLLAISFSVLSIFSNVFPTYGQTDQMLGSNVSIFHDDFNWGVQPNYWYNVTGVWSYTSEGLHGGISDNGQIPSKSILISPGLASNQFNISSFMQIKDHFRDGETAHPVALVYSFIDPENYKYAGINVYSNRTYVQFGDVVNGSEYHSPGWLGNDTGIKYEPGSHYSLNMTGKGSTVNFYLNNTKYQHYESSPLENGYYGLLYGKIRDLTFNDFDSKVMISSNNDVSFNKSNTESNNQTNRSLSVNNVNNHDYNVADSNTILLSDKSLPEGSYMHLYDSTPYSISQGNIVAKFSCDEEGLTNVNILIGSTPNLFPAKLEVIEPLSNPGELCSYRVDLTPEIGQITDIAIQNNSTEDIDFPPTSTVNINVNNLKK